MQPDVVARPFIFQTMSSVGSNCLKHKLFTPSGFKDIWIRKLECKVPLNDLLGSPGSTILSSSAVFQDENWNEEGEAYLPIPG